MSFRWRVSSPTNSRRSITSSSSSLGPSSSFRASSATTASPSRTTRPCRRSMSPSWHGATSRSRSTATAATRASAGTALHRQPRLRTPRPPAPQLRRLIASAGRRIPDSGTIDSWPSRLRRASETLPLDGPSRYVAYMTHLNGLRRDRLYTDEYRELVGRSSAAEVIEGPWRDSPADSIVDVMLDVDIQTYLPDDLLVKMDIATMASSLEARSPLLDHELMEFAASLPPSSRCADARRRSSSARAPWLDPRRDSWTRPSVASACRWGLAARRAARLRARRPARPDTVGGDCSEQEYVRELLDRHDAEVQDHSQGIWTLLMFELWHREFVDVPPHRHSAAQAGARAG